MMIGKVKKTMGKAARDMDFFTLPIIMPSSSPNLSAF